MGRAGQRRSGEAPYGAEALIRDEPPDGPEAEAFGCAEALTDEPTNGARGGGAYGTSLLTLITGGAYATSHLTGRRRLRDEPPYGRRRLRDEPPYIRDDPPCAEALKDEPPHPHGPEALTGRASLRRRFRDERPYGPEALTGRASLRRRFRDERPYGPEALTGRASLQARITSLYTGPLPRDFVPAPRKPPLSSFPVKGPVSP